jgi:hypothetical protein
MVVERLPAGFGVEQRGREGVGDDADDRADPEIQQSRRRGQNRIERPSDRGDEGQALRPRRRGGLVDRDARRPPLPSRRVVTSWSSLNRASCCETIGWRSDRMFSSSVTVRSRSAS